MRRFKKKCLGQMDNVANKEGRTVLFVSHNMAMIENLCRVSLGRRRAVSPVDGAPNEVISNYLAELSQMNSIPLVQRTDREGRGDVRAVAVELRNAAGNTAGRPAPVSNSCFGCIIGVNQEKIIREPVVFPSRSIKMRNCNPLIHRSGRQDADRSRRRRQHRSHCPRVAADRRQPRSEHFYPIGAGRFRIGWNEPRKCP